MDFMLQLDDLIPRTVPVLYCLLLIAMMCATRYVMRSWLLGQGFRDIFPLLKPQPHSKRTGNGIPVAIYGAGEAGTQLMYALDRGREYHPVAFIDDDRSLRGRVIGGRSVYMPRHISNLITETLAEEILLAMPSLARGKRRAIVHQLQEYGLPIRTMPGMADIASGRMALQEIRDVDIGDVLGREEVKPDATLMNRNITGQVVMVTGAGGSIGSELCRQILAVGPKSLVLLEHA
ncbi:MAG: hypothetical protein B0D91_14775 [Oceanospirillales bacterium LUC14_002_19_P2]|nr:MAG: hypothetical protein B0D91_14775 [Oceanospirillales bacterium LUC14_002_19_P2]